MNCGCGGGGWWYKDDGIGPGEFGVLEYVNP